MKKHKKHHNNYEYQSVYADSCNKLYNWEIIGKHQEKQVIFFSWVHFAIQYRNVFSLHFCGIYLARDSLRKSTICPQTDLYDWASTCSFTFLFLHHTKRFVLIFILCLIVSPNVFFSFLFSPRPLVISQFLTSGMHLSRWEVSFPMRIQFLWS